MLTQHMQHHHILRLKAARQANRVTSSSRKTRPPLLCRDHLIINSGSTTGSFRHPRQAAKPLLIRTTPTRLRKPFNLREITAHSAPRRNRRHPCQLQSPHNTRQRILRNQSIIHNHGRSPRAQSIPTRAPPAQPVPQPTRTLPRRSSATAALDRSDDHRCANRRIRHRSIRISAHPAILRDTHRRTAASSSRTPPPQYRSSAAV